MLLTTVVRVQSTVLSLDDFILYDLVGLGNICMMWYGYTWFKRVEVAVMKFLF